MYKETTMKKMIKRALWALGYEIKERNTYLPSPPDNSALIYNVFLERLYKDATIKNIIKRALWALGCEINKRSTYLPSPPDCSVLVDNVFPGPWVSGVLEMSNRSYRPPVLQQHGTTKFGDDTRFGDNICLKYITNFLDVRDQRILEIGPLEAYYSILLEKMGVRENIAIEARTTNLQKCQRIKEKYHLDYTQFVQANLERLYSGKDVLGFQGPFDLVFCLGVFYHLPDPGRALVWMRSQSSTLFLGTFYCEGTPRQNDVEYVYCGSSYRARWIPEGGVDDPTAGMSPSSLQLYESDLLRLIQDVGYSRISVLGRDIENNGYHITLIAEI
jgi:hypothetical protein